MNAFDLPKDVTVTVGSNGPLWGFVLLGAAGRTNLSPDQARVIAWELLDQADNADAMRRAVKAGATFETSTTAAL